MSTTAMPTVYVHTRRGHEVGIVEAAAILSIGNDSVIPFAATTKVVLLEVTRDLVKPIAVSTVSVCQLK
jgi:hypothetical protein